MSGRSAGVKWASMKTPAGTATGEADQFYLTADLPLDPAGTEFQRRVWRALRRIPSGSTASYADIARRIDAPCSRARGGRC